jgi:hypothetical protein
MWYSLLITRITRPIKLKYYWSELNTIDLFHNPLFLLLTYNKTLLNQHDSLVIFLVYSIKKGSGLMIMWGWRVTNICVFFVLLPLITIWQEYDVECKSIGNIIWYKYSALRYYYHWTDTSGGGLLVPDHIIYPAVSVSAMSWFIIISTFFFCHWADTSADGLLVPDHIIPPAVSVSLLIPDHIICPAVSVSAMTWLTRYIHYWN